MWLGGVHRQSISRQRRDTIDSSIIDVGNSSLRNCVGCSTYRSADDQSTADHGSTMAALVLNCATFDKERSTDASSAQPQHTKRMVTETRASQPEKKWFFESEPRGGGDDVRRRVNQINDANQISKGEKIIGIERPREEAAKEGKERPVQRVNQSTCIASVDGELYIIKRVR